jgi:hypothetical protein
LRSLPEGVPRVPVTLHITNGESVQLGQTGLGGEVLCWNDILHEGPVPEGLTLDELGPVRARFIASLAFGGYEESSLLKLFEERNRKLAAFASFQEIVLWFEGDLYDQLQLLEILDWFRPRSLNGTRLALITVDTYLGMLDPAHLKDLYPARHEVTPEELGLAERAWKAFRSPDPRGFARLLEEDTSALPLLRGALRRHLEQFPSVANGLSRSERQILEAAEDGRLNVAELFVEDQQREERIFAGDLVFFNFVRNLADCRVPLIALTPPEASEDSNLAFRKSAVRLTAAGRAVLANQSDHVRLNGIDRWLGGVHLRSNDFWRWDSRARTLVRAHEDAGEPSASNAPQP